MSSSTLIDMDLDKDEDHPRRLVSLSHHILAYGGDNGTISMLTSSNKFQTVRRFDDAVRAVAVSHDAKRIAVGFEDGSTTVFCYDDYIDKTEPHPFCSSTSNDDDDIADAFLSQPDDETHETSFPGPRFDCPVRCLEFDPRNYYLAIASESGFCIVDATSAQALQAFGRQLADVGDQEHASCGIRGLAYTTTTDKMVLLFTLDMDGRLCSWNVTGDDVEVDWELHHRDLTKCIPKPDVGEINGADPYDRSCLPICQDNRLALPGRVDVQLRSGEFKESRILPSLPEQGHTDTIVACAFSPQSDYLVTSGRDSRVVLWKLNEDDSSESIGSFGREIGQYKSIPTFLKWCTDENDKQVLYIAFADSTLAVVPSDQLVASSSSSSLQEAAESSTASSQQEEDDTEAAVLAAVKSPSKASRGHLKRLSKKSGDNLSDDDSDQGLGGDNEDDVGSTKEKARVSFLEDEAQEDKENDSVVEKDDNVALGDDKNDEIVMNDDDEDLEFAVQDDYQDHHGDVSSSRYMTNNTATEPQPAFAPSSTPLGLSRRILCWNHIGAATLFSNQDGLSHNAIDIDFTNVAARRPISFTDNMNFILGSLGEDGAVFCTDLKDDDEDDMDNDGEDLDGLHMSEGTKSAVRRSQRKRLKGDHGNGSSVYFYRYETFGALKDKDWYLTLPDGELAMGCACGEGWAAVMTSRRFLRLFSSGGNQGDVIWLKGEPVTIVGRSRFVAVFYHDGTPLPDGTQKLGYLLLDAVANRTIATGPVSCVSSGASLSWAGFGDDFSLSAMDSDGMLSTLVCKPSSHGDPASMEVGSSDSSYSWLWQPMLDTVGRKKSADENFWPVTIQAGKFVCVPLKGGNEHPEAARRPVTHAMSLRMPLARATLDKSTPLEELVLRAATALNQKRFLNEITGDVEDEDVQAEYAALCGQVDKVTLKLFIATVKAGKLERALDLVDRLHLEKSFEIAMKVADTCNHRNLSDRIVDVQERKFAAPIQSSDESMGDTQSAVDYNRSTPSSPYAESLGSTRISPENPRKRSLGDAYDSDAESPSVNQKMERKRTSGPSNPFAKTRIESPATPTRNSYLSVTGKSPSKMSLSRSSTFSLQSRHDSKLSKRII